MVDECHQLRHLAISPMLLKSDWSPCKLKWMLYILSCGHEEFSLNVESSIKLIDMNHESNFRGVSNWLVSWLVDYGGIAHGPLARYVKLRVAHGPGIPGTFYPPPISKEIVSWWPQHASRHVRDVRAVMHVGIVNPRWRGKRSRHSRRMRNP